LGGELQSSQEKLVQLGAKFEKLEANLDELQELLAEIRRD
jgi:hypothetical protein